MFLEEVIGHRDAHDPGEGDCASPITPANFIDRGWWCRRWSRGTGGFVLPVLFVAPILIVGHRRFPFCRINPLVYRHRLATVVRQRGRCVAGPALLIWCCRKCSVTGSCRRRTRTPGMGRAGWIVGVALATVPGAADTRRT